VEKMKITGTHHLSFITKNAKATYEFYSGVLGMPLVAAVTADHFNGEFAPHLKLSFGLEDGSTVDFVEFKPEWQEKLAPQFPYRHYAFETEGADGYQFWKNHLKEKKVPFREVNHDDIFHSMYFYDPNNILMEITRHARPLDAALEKEALEQWELYNQKFAQVVAERNLVSANNTN
jgi:catechol 2,3-dioxygenase-like lactoylglutathione lyase family enzyme